MSEPAFPRPDAVWEDKINGGMSGTQGHPGMTLRDYFAGQALVGMVAGGRGLDITVEQFAEQSYKIADALLAEREGK